MKTLTENLNTILDNFQMVVGSGMTTRSCFVMNDSRKRREDTYKSSFSFDIQSDFDGLYPIEPQIRTDYISNVYEILTKHPVSDKDKELLKEWFLSGGDVMGYRYGDMEHLTWWRFTKGLVWKFSNYLIVNLEDENLKTIDERLSISLVDMIFDLTSWDGEGRISKYSRTPHQYKSLQERYVEDPETKKVEREIEELKSQVQELITQLKTKEEKLESLVV